MLIRSNNYPILIGGELMKLVTLTALLNTKKDILDSLDYAYTFLDKKLDFKAFSCTEDMERFANSQDENVEQIVLKKFNGKKSLFIRTHIYDAVIVYDGYGFLTTSYWLRRKPQLIEKVDLETEIDYTKFKEEILRLFAEANEDTKKLAS